MCGSSERLDASYYNEDYFRPGPRSSYILPFTWEVEKAERIKTAQFFNDTFHPKNVLDVGCAKGFLCKALLQIGIDAYGCDISNFAVNNCEAEVKERLKVVDIRDGLPYSDNSFDLVCSYATLEHIEMEFLKHTASEIARVSRKWVFINTPISLSNENKPWGDPSHRTYLPASFWISLFYNGGLICDLRLSHQISNHPFHSTELTFCKGELPE